MCGISALFSTKNKVTLADIQKMSGQIVHRGPDDEGYLLVPSDHRSPIVVGGQDTPPEVYAAHWNYCPKDSPPHPDSASYKLALGHRRLSIVDLSPAGHQPMCSEDSYIWITYNGEVYNYIEIRDELLKLGCHFHTQSDTEVIVKAYQTWGIDCLHKFNGMFSFVICDLKTQQVFAARDRFGVKPLYYWISPEGTLALASEIKQFTVLKGWSSKLHGQCAYDFLNWGVIDHTHSTLFDGVRQVRGGEYLSFSLRSPNLSHLHPIRWYNLQSTPFHGSFQDATEHYRDLLTDAVRIRLRADVDVGSCLSGGLDSSAIVCLANQLLQEQHAVDKQKTFSACSEVDRFDERAFVEMVVEATGVQAHYTYPCKDKLFNECDKILWHQDEPFVSTSIYAQWEVFKQAKESHVKVMLDGQGADEQLAGYHGFFGNRFFDLFQSLQWKSLIQEIRQAQQMHQNLQPWPLLLNKLVPDTLRQPLRKMLGKSAAKPDWLNVPLLQADDQDPFVRYQNKTLVEQSHLQLMHSSLPMLLHYEDRDSMAHSVESRTPFLDYRLVEFALGLPGNYKISQGWTKRVLRESMHGTLPEKIRRRTDKLGFVTAEEEWVRTHAPDRFLKSIDEAIEASQGILKPSAKDLAQKIVSGKLPYSFLLWRLINFGNWIKQFSVSIT